MITTESVTSLRFTNLFSKGFIADGWLSSRRRERGGTKVQQRATDRSLLVQTLITAPTLGFGTCRYWGKQCEVRKWALFFRAIIIVNNVSGPQDIDFAP